MGIYKKYNTNQAPAARYEIYQGRGTTESSSWSWSADGSDADAEGWHKKKKQQRPTAAATVGVEMMMIPGTTTAAAAAIIHEETFTREQVEHFHTKERRGLKLYQEGQL